MNLTRAKSLPGLLALTLLAGSLAGVGLSAPAFAADADPSAPSASYALNVTSLWAGQSVTLTESDLVDDDTAPVDLKREVTWGDGSPVSTMPADGSTLTHRYEAAGDFPVSVKITDTSGKSADGTFPTSNIVKVTTVPGRFKIASRTRYWGESLDIRDAKAAEHVQPAKVSITGLTADVTSGKIEWGDGEASAVDAGTTEVTHAYAFGVDHTYPISVTLSNAAGAVGPRSLGSIQVLEDTFSPKGTITTPKNKTKVSSWKTVSGTASDKGLGVDQIAVGLVQKRGESWYFYTGRTWEKAASLENAEQSVEQVFVTLSAGTWSTKINGLTKGTLRISVLITDLNLARGAKRARNYVWVDKEQKLTK